MTLKNNEVNLYYSYKKIQNLFLMKKFKELNNIYSMIFL